MSVKSLDDKIKTLGPDYNGDKGDSPRHRRGAILKLPHLQDTTKRRTLNLTGIVKGVKGAFSKTHTSDKDKSQTEEDTSEASSSSNTSAEQFYQQTTISSSAAVTDQPVRVVSRVKSFKNRVKQRKAFAAVEDGHEEEEVGHHDEQ
jgi:hypothetical protein